MVGRGGVFLSVGWLLGVGLVGPVLVVVGLVGRKNPARMGLFEDEDVVEDLAPDAADGALASGVPAGAAARS